MNMIYRRFVGATSIILLWASCLAAILPNVAYKQELTTRGTSKDSCPNGWLCQQQQCDAPCPAGEVCVTFDGTKACAPPNKKWCALNPSTLQAVECEVNGVCWYASYLSFVDGFNLC